MDAGIVSRLNGYVPQRQGTPEQRAAVSFVLNFDIVILNLFGA